MSDIHFDKVSSIADTTQLLLGLILYMLNMKISGNPREVMNQMNIYIKRNKTNCQFYNGC